AVYTCCVSPGSGERIGRGWWLEAGGWRLEAGGWRLEAGGWRLEAGQCADLRLTPDKLFRSAFQPLALLSAFFILERSADALDKSSRLAGQSACHGWRRTDHLVAGAFRYLAAGVALHRPALFGVAHAGAETRRAARLVLRLRPVQLRRQLGLRQHP